MSTDIFKAATLRNGPMLTSSGVYNNSNDACFSPIPGLDISLETFGHEQLLITLTAPDTWADAPGQGAWFAIEVDGKIVTRGCYNTGAAGQRVPLSLNTSVNLPNPPAAKCRVVGKWVSNNAGQNAHIGSFSETTLTVLAI